MNEESIDQIIRVHLAARCPYLYLVSWEEERVLEHLAVAAEDLFERVYVWSITEGFRTDGFRTDGLRTDGSRTDSSRTDGSRTGGSRTDGGETLDKKYRGPYAALGHIGANSKKSLFVLLDFHPYIREAKVTRRLRDLIGRLQSTSSSVVLLSPKLELPDELEKDVTVIDYPLPTVDNIQSLFETIEKGVQANPSLHIDLGEDDRDRLLQAALGLTENEAKNVFAKALARDRSLSVSDLDVVLAEKEQIVRKSGILEYFSTPEDFDSVGGMDQLKSWLDVRSDALSRKAREFGLPPPKGLLLIGVPGCGKSLTAKAVSREWNQPRLKLDVGKLFGGLVGSSEANVRRAIQFAEAVAPCILWIDEIEKGFAGFRSFGDSGTSARVFSTFLTWMQEKSSPVFVMATANDISALPPELLRKGRFDEIFFVDLPFVEERAQILGIHIGKRGRDAHALGIDLERLAEASEGFSGAELEQAVIAALYKAFAAGSELGTEDIVSAIEETFPLSETMKEPIRAMRQWARHRARYASSMWRDQQGQAQQVGRWASIGN